MSAWRTGASTVTLPLLSAHTFAAAPLKGAPSISDTAQHCPADECAPASLCPPGAVLKVTFRSATTLCSEK
eukprot:COSAG02_NODE_4618_length_5158_cov_10.405021_2_plen_71_part_00